MACKIPDAGNPMGGEAVLRQPTQVNPNIDAKVERVDLIPLLDSATNVAKAYKQQKESELNAIAQQGNNDFDEHMAAYEIDLKNSRKGWAAKDFYKAMKDESYRYYNDITGDPKDDGKFRIANPDAKKQLLNYINQRQKSFISSSAAYEAQQIEEAQRSTYEAGLTNAANRAATAITNSDLQDAMADIQRIGRVQWRGMDPMYIQQNVAKLQDAAASTYIANRINVHPLEALRQLKTNPNAYMYLSDDSKAKLTDSIQKAWHDREVTNVMDASDAWELSDAVIREVYGQDISNAEVELIRNEIESEGRRKQAEARAKAADAHAAIVTDMWSNVANAQTAEDRQSAMAALAEFDPQGYDAVNLVNQNIADYEYAERVMRDAGIELPEIPEASMREFVGVTGPSDDWVRALPADSALRRGVEGAVRNPFARYDAEKIQQFQKQYSDFQTRLNALPAADRDVVQRMLDWKQGRILNHAARIEDYTKIAAGERDLLNKTGIQNYDPVTQRSMLRAVRGLKQYDAVRAELRMGDVNLDDILKQPRYAELQNDIPKQLALKQNLALEVQRYKEQNKTLPTADVMERLVSNAMAAARTPADEINSSLSRITATGHLDRAILTGKKYAGKKTTMEQRREVYDNAIDTMLSESDLNFEQRALIKMFREDIISSLVATGSAQTILEDILGVY